MRTFRTIGVIGTAAVLLFSATIVFAEGQATSTSRKGQTGEQRGALASTTQEESVGNTERARMQTVREEAQAGMTTQREKMAQRMTEIQDKVKQTQAQKIAVQFDNLNTTWTDHFMNLLDRYDAILQKIQDRATIAAGNGKNIATTTAAIQSAKTVITNARTAVTAQAAKTYTPDTSVITTTDSTTSNGQGELMKGMRTSFQNLHSTLFKDLFALRDGPMKDARGAVQNALQTLGKIPGVDDEKNATTTKSNQ